MINVLLTRSEDENNNLKNSLKPDDFNFIECPLIEYKNVKLPIELLYKYSNFIITSKQAAIILASYTQGLILQINIWVVGKLSAEILCNKNIKIAYIAIDVEDLIKNIPKNLYENIIYFSANEITKPLPYGIKRQVIYDVEYKDKLNNYEISIFKTNIDYIMLYSKNTAKTLIRLLTSENLLKNVENTTVIAISAKVAKEVLSNFKKIIYCNEGEQNKMTELLISNASKTRNQSKDC